ncbi:MAG TPA: hypothetical protein VFB06_30870 [Streptosporangiaceae bacterium]|nr:hypothetical protein [Streptosporangiaceae bacterium]
MTASNPAADQSGTGCPPAVLTAAPRASGPRASGRAWTAKWATSDPLTDPNYSRWRRERYSWLYEDEDIWASL